MLSRKVSSESSSSTSRHISGFATLPGVEDGRVVRVWPRIGVNLVMNTKQAKEIVPPEPHSTSPDVRKAWHYMPRWLQVVLLLAFIVVGILVAIFMK